MTRNYNFNDVKKYLDNKSGGDAFLDAFSAIADVVVIFSPVLMGPQFLPLLEFLDIKDRIVDAGKKLIGFIETQTAPNYKERMQQIESAYAILCVTAYFEALKEKLSSSEVKDVINYFKENHSMELPIDESKKELLETNSAISIIFLDEVEPLETVKDNLKNFYEKTCKNLSDHFDKVISLLEREDKDAKSDSKTINKLKNIKNALNKVSELALKNYVAQLIDLMTSFPDFAAYVQLREFSLLKTMAKQTNQRLLSYDIGLNNLSNLIKSIRSIQRTEEAEEICTDLKKYYDNEIGMPIIKANEGDENELAGGVTTENENSDLVFPAIADAYISQAFKCLRYTGSSTIKSLENPNVWRDLPVIENIGDFFIKYLCLPSSVEYPLIVLGLPGSGKSILTKMLSAQLMGSLYTVIRIPLRNIDANNDIDVVISEQIAKNIQLKLSHGYGAFAKHFENSPLLIIFDGYDELLQVKGDIFNGFVSKIHAFQENQNALGRPVRVMITSRLTLIDQVTIPKNSVILNLEKFDQERRNAWIQIWNDTNSEYFSRNSIKPFYLKSEKELPENVKDLAEQPLLLLMLALFDSYGNALESISENMNRTHLYDELLRRFCRREILKNHKKVTGDKIGLDEKYVQDEMTRLGIVAIGMFNRQKLHIHTKDLLSDLITFKVINERDVSREEADTLIRSFFFVNKSEANIENKFKKEYAYEFLHNTFGEFLTADFILNYLIRETIALSFARKNKYQENIVQNKLYDPNGLGYEWFLNLMFTPLYKRPLVLEMIREHLPCVLDRFEFSKKDFQKSMNEIVETQLKMFLEEKVLPTVIYQPDGFKDLKISLIGHISTYTLNITILASLLSSDGFVFYEGNYSSETLQDSQDSEIRPWDKLTNLWKTWFSSDNLTGLARVIKSFRNEKIITIKCRDQFDNETDMNKIEKQLSVANALSDDMSIALCGLQTTKFSEITRMNDSDILAFLCNVNKNLYAKYIVNMIRREISGLTRNANFSSINDLLNRLLEIDTFGELSHDVIIEIFVVVEISLAHHVVYIGNQRQINKLINSVGEREIFTKNKSISILMHRILISLLRNIDNAFDDEYMYRFENDYRRIMIDNDRFQDHFISIREKEMFFCNNNRRYLYRFEENIYETIDGDNIGEYMKSDPEMVSRYILYVSQQREVSPDIIRMYLRIIDENFLNIRKRDYSISRNKINDRLPFVNTKILLYSIQIAESINETDYIRYAQRTIVELIRRLHPEYIMNLLFTDTKLFDIVIKYLPELFYDILKYTERDIEHYFERRLRRISLFIALDFILLLRKIEHSSNKFHSEINLTVGKYILINLENSLKRYDNLKDILSVTEYDNLIWFIQNNKTTANNKMLKSLLKK